MPHPNAKSHVASSKTCNKADVFVANPKDINDVEENMNILEDWELFEITHNSFQNYALKTIKWHKKADKKLNPTFYTILNCCARHTLTMEPDFLEQKTSIAETVEAAKHIFELYSKFHCECNFIECF
ncbi:24404_t:CDS:2 [Cetraspora pellucida]|uniref:24404_t:CDS:1 n=1 Tax=Cetraspora pellucida TaxID=1433469 RepID=A0A9N9ELP1_9GLOM|nr:24404_t:CDS:2 [Cetraspora pellucida]